MGRRLEHSPDERAPARFLDDLAPALRGGRRSHSRSTRIGAAPGL